MSVSFDSVEWSNKYTTIKNEICNECVNHTVNVNDVENSINKLKIGKSDGFDSITSDYLINASPLCFVYLSYLCTTMLYYCFISKSLCHSTMIPIPKHLNKDTSDIKNYRGTFISSFFSKVFDSYITSLNSVVLRSDGIQFAYKKSCSTIQCVSMVTDVINYHINNDSSVYMCMLDASKSFDRVILITLFRVVFWRQYCIVCTWTSSYQCSDILVWDFIWIVYSQECLYMLMTLRYWHHQEQVWLICWNSVKVFRELILLYVSKTKYMGFKRREIGNVAPQNFTGSLINCVHECDSLGITLLRIRIRILSNRTTDNVIAKAVMKFNIKSNEVFSYFKWLPCYIKSFTTFCIDAVMEFRIEKRALFLCRLEKSIASIMVFTILLTATCCIQVTTHSLLKYHWRREVLNQFGHVWIVKIML